MQSTPNTTRGMGATQMLLARLALIVPALLLGAATNGWSQQLTEPAPEPPTARYFIVTAGAAFGADTVPTFSGEYGEAVSKHVMAFVNYAYYDDLMTDVMRSNLTLAGDVLTRVTGNTRTFTGRDRGLAFTGGAKYMFGSGGFRPYVGAGLGALHLKRTINEASLGDVTTSFASESGLNDGVIAAGATTGMKALAEGIVGVYAAGRRTSFDVSYRYRKAFHAAELSFAQFGVGVGVSF
jgi:hypothetical protein